jgi:hypothetical protein
MITLEHLAMHQDAIFKRLNARANDLERYARTIADLQSTDVASDAVYQRRFNGLYGVRRNAQWREIFYAMLERHKGEPDLEFRFVLMKLHEKTGRVEASFASKLIATINPMRPVYDSIVRSNLGIPNRTIGAASRIDRLCSDYRTIGRSHEEQIARSTFRSLRARFEREFPQFRFFTDMKVLDLMIWQIR